jgi:hypothetical protein
MDKIRDMKHLKAYVSNFTKYLFSKPHHYFSDILYSCIHAQFWQVRYNLMLSENVATAGETYRELLHDRTRTFYK